MEKIAIKRFRIITGFLAAFFLMLLASEEMLVMAQGIRNQRARQDVRGTSRRTARRVNRRHDYWQSGSSDVYVESAPVEVVEEEPPMDSGILYSLPGGCVEESGIYNCNGVRYQAQMQGTTVVYVQI